jgi:hypothetical protein
MTVNQLDVVDFITINNAGEAVLTVSDPLPWKRVDEHLCQLQEKLNAYLIFIESGQLHKKCPPTRGCPIIIEVVMKHEAPRRAIWFFDQVAEIIEAAGFQFILRTIHHY